MLRASLVVIARSPSISFKNFLFHQRMYVVSFKRIDNSPNFTTISTIAARESFKKIKKLLRHFFVVIHNIVEWKKKKKKIVRVTAWSKRPGMPHMYIWISLNDSSLGYWLENRSFLSYYKDAIETNIIKEFIILWSSSLYQSGCISRSPWHAFAKGNILTRRLYLATTHGLHGTANTTRDHELFLYFSREK